MSGQSKEKKSEETKKHAAEMYAVRIYCLRHNILKGKASKSDFLELKNRTLVLASLYEVPNDKAKIGFQIRFSGAPVAKEWPKNLGKILIEIKNPNATEIAEGTQIISLIERGFEKYLTEDFGKCEILASELGGI